MTKIAICTHCQKPITYDEAKRMWRHDETGSLSCTHTELATPKRGSIKKEA